MLSPSKLTGSIRSITKDGASSSRVSEKTSPTRGTHGTRKSGRKPWGRGRRASAAIGWSLPILRSQADVFAMAELRTRSRLTDPCLYREIPLRSRRCGGLRLQSSPRPRQRRRSHRPQRGQVDHPRSGRAQNRKGRDRCSVRLHRLVELVGRHSDRRRMGRKRRESLQTVVLNLRRREGSAERSSRSLQCYSRQASSKDVVAAMSAGR